MGGGKFGSALGGAALGPILSQLLAKKKKPTAPVDPAAAPGTPAPGMAQAGAAPPATGLMAPRPQGFNLLSDDPNVRARQRGFNRMFGF
jgi:hypothetical protein